MTIFTLLSKRSPRLLVLLLLILGSFNLSAQKSAEFKVAKAYLETNLTQFELSTADIAEMNVRTEYTDKQTGITHIYLQQTSNGIEIMDGSIGIHLNKERQVIYATSQFEKQMNQRRTSTSPGLSATAALQVATQEVGISLDEPATVLSAGKTSARSTVFSKGNLTAEDIPAKLVYLKNEKDELVLCWLVQMYEKSQLHDWHVYVDARNGEIVKKHDIVLHCDFGGAAPVTDAPNEVKTPYRHNHNHNHNHNHGTKVEKAAHTAVAEMPGVPKEANFFDQFFVNSTYLVYAEPDEAPNSSGGRRTVSTDGDPVASPFGWHSTSQGLFNNFTTGNNVAARNNIGAVSPLGTRPDMPTFTSNGNLNPPYEFDYPVDFTQGPETYTDAAVTNLFYWNNVIHDVYYQLGFTEETGNFQTTNQFGADDRRRFGTFDLGSNDAVLAEAQDGEANNNANMRTLPDGVNPVMQMYLWTADPPTELVFLNTVNGLPDNTAYIGIEGAFGTNNSISQTGLTAPLIAMDASGSAVGEDVEGCGTGAGVGLPPDNSDEMAGKIVLIRRGNCSFIEKILSAQLGGAVGVIVFNNAPGAGPISMGGDESGNAVLIPTCMISQPNGQMLLDQLEGGDDIILTLKREDPRLPELDGDFDNGIIAHEYGHGISNRLTGGPDGGSLGGNEQGGEGWSDFIALYMTTQTSNLGSPTVDHPNGTLPPRGIGTYVIFEQSSGQGIRPARYSGDFGINPYTYGDILNPEITIPHGVGFIWCTMIYDMMQNIIDMVPVNNDLYNSGLDDDLTGGGNRQGSMVAAGW